MVSLLWTSVYRATKGRRARRRLACQCFTRFTELSKSAVYLPNEKSESELVPSSQTVHWAGGRSTRCVPYDMQYWRGRAEGRTYVGIYSAVMSLCSDNGQWWWSWRREAEKGERYLSSWGKMLGRGNDWSGVRSSPSLLLASRSFKQMWRSSAGSLKVTSRAKVRRSQLSVWDAGLLAERKYVMQSAARTA